jgi:hypothetical protein
VFFSDRSDSTTTITETGTFADFGGLEGEQLAPGLVDENGLPVATSDLGATSTVNRDTAYEPAILRQLTTRHVAGYGEFELASTTYIFYMESGVGHIYGINLKTGEEERISVTTIPNTKTADFSPIATVAAVKAGNTMGKNPLLLVTIDLENKTVATEEIAPEVDQFAFMSDGTLLYTTVTNNSVVVHRYNTTEQVSDVLFTTPFREAVIRFGEAVTGPHLFQPKSSYLFEGFAYIYENGELRRLPTTGYNFSTAVGPNQVLVTKRNGSGLTSQVLSYTGITQALPFDVVPDKCVSSTTTFYCAVSVTEELNYNSLDEWYKGRLQYQDNLWSITGTEQTELINITAFSGQRVDVTNSELGIQSGNWYFTNKPNSTLWVYELPRLVTGATTSTTTNSENL